MKSLRILVFLSMLTHNITPMDLSSQLAQLEVSLETLAQTLKEIAEKKNRIQQQLQADLDFLSQSIQNLLNETQPQSPATYFNEHIQLPLTRLLQKFNVLSPAEYVLGQEVLAQYLTKQLETATNFFGSLDTSEANRQQISTASRLIAAVLKLLVQNSTVLPDDTRNKLIDNLTNSQTNMFKRYITSTGWYQKAENISKAQAVDQALGDIYHYQRISGDADSLKTQRELLEEREIAIKIAENASDYIEKIKPEVLVRIKTDLEKAINSLREKIGAYKPNEEDLFLRKNPSVPVRKKIGTDLTENGRAFMKVYLFSKLCDKFTSAIDENNKLYYYAIIIITSVDEINKILASIDTYNFSKTDLVGGLQDCLDKVSQFRQAKTQQSEAIIDEGLPKLTAVFDEFSATKTYDKKVLEDALTQLREARNFATDEKQEEIRILIAENDAKILKNLAEQIAQLQVLEGDEQEKKADELDEAIKNFQEFRNTYKDLLTDEKEKEHVEQLNKLSGQVQAILAGPLISLKRATRTLVNLIDEAFVANFLPSYSYETFIAPKLQEVKNFYQTLDDEGQRSFIKKATQFYTGIIEKLQEKAQTIDPSVVNEKTIKLVAIIEILQMLITSSTPELLQAGTQDYTKVTNVIDKLAQQYKPMILKNIDEAEKKLGAYRQYISENFKFKDDPMRTGKAAIITHETALQTANEALNSVEEFLRDPNSKLINNYFPGIKERLKAIMLLFKVTSTDSGIVINQMALFNIYENKIALSLDEARRTKEQDEATYFKLMLSPIKYEGRTITENQAYQIFGLQPDATKGKILQAFSQKTKGLSQDSEEFKNLSYLRSDLIDRKEAHNKIILADEAYQRALQENAELRKKIEQLRRQQQEYEKRLANVEEQVRKF